MKRSTMALIALAGPLLAALLTLLSGCAILNRIPDLIPPVTTPTPEPVPSPVVTPPTPIPTAPPTPEPPSPSPFGRDDAYPPTSGGTNVDDTPDLSGLDSFARAINSAIDVATGRADVGTTIQNTHDYYRAVKDYLRNTHGFLVNYDWRGDADRHDSEISIWRGCRIESFQILTSAKRTRKAPGAFRGFNNLVDCTHGCALQHPLKNGYALLLEVGKHGQGLEWDGTPVLFNEDRDRMPPIGWTGACLPRRCFIAAEKDGESGAACTRELCGTTLTYSVVEGDAMIVDRGYTAKITPGAGGALIRASCPADPSATTTFPVGR